MFSFVVHDVAGVVSVSEYSGDGVSGGWCFSGDVWYFSGGAWYRYERLRTSFELQSISTRASSAVAVSLESRGRKRLPAKMENTCGLNVASDQLNQCR